MKDRITEEEMYSNNFITVEGSFMYQMKPACILHDLVNTIQINLSQLNLHRPNRNCSSPCSKDLPQLLPVAGLILAAIWK